MRKPEGKGLKESLKSALQDLIFKLRKLGSALLLTNMLEFNFLFLNFCLCVYFF